MAISYRVDPGFAWEHFCCFAASVRFAERMGGGWGVDGGRKEERRAKRCNNKDRGEAYTQARM